MSNFLFYDDMLINVLLKKEKPSGGAAVQTYAWIRGLIENGQKVSALTNILDTKLIKNENKDIPLIPLYNPNKGIRWIRWIYYRIPYLFHRLRENNPDYLIQGIPHWSSVVWGIMCLLLKIKFIIRVSCDHLIDKRFFQFHNRFHKIFMNIGFSLSFAIICQNEYQYKILKSKYPNKKIYKFGNPFYNNQKLEINTYTKRDYIAWIGLFQYQKNLALLYTIASQMKNVKFKIAGKENFVSIDIKTKESIQKLHTLKNVEFVGFLDREKIIGFIQKAKFLLCTSHYEGFSNTFLESMVCGTPIITNENANPDSIISDFNLGFIYNNKNDLKSKFESITPEDFIKISQNSISYINSYHNYKILAKKLINRLENIDDESDSVDRINN